MYKSILDHEKAEYTYYSTFKSLLSSGGVANIAIIQGEETYVERFLAKAVNLTDYREISSIVRHIGVTKGFKEVIDYFKIPAGQTPAGFRLEFIFTGDQTLKADLVRDISYDKNGVKRPTKILFSADSANPYEVAPIRNMIANLTCNPSIIYDLFINNLKANVGQKFKNRDEVIGELGRILGPGCDISVELNNPFAPEEELLEEAYKFQEMLSKYRVVIKVPHTGPVNKDNVNELLMGDKKLQRRYDEGKTEDYLRGHNLALMLYEHGFRVNFTLMFEPYQTAMALQARPYFINSFIRHRHIMSGDIRNLLASCGKTRDSVYLKQLRTYMIEKDILAPKDADLDLSKGRELGEWMLKYRRLETAEGFDGLDGVRHNLRVLRQSHLKESRLIICSMEGNNYADIDRMLMEDEFRDMQDRVVITAEPDYLARFTSTPQVVSYQRRFMNAAQGQKPDPVLRR